MKIMNITTGPRQSGKTTKMLDQIAEEYFSGTKNIVCAVTNNNMARLLAERLQRLIITKDSFSDAPILSNTTLTGSDGRSIIFMSYIDVEKRIDMFDSEMKMFIDAGVLDTTIIASNRAGDKTGMFLYKVLFE